MAVRWPDGSYTGSVRVGKNPPASVVVGEPKPEETDNDKTKEAS